VQIASFLDQLFKRPVIEIHERRAPSVADTAASEQVAGAEEKNQG
jgi:hypothetical protein